MPEHLVAVEEDGTGVLWLVQQGYEWNNEIQRWLSKCGTCGAYDTTWMLSYPGAVFTHYCYRKKQGADLALATYDEAWE